jgi:hypothetical protein
MYLAGYLNYWEPTLPEAQLSDSKRLLQIRFGYMQLIVSVSRVSNLNHRKWGIETENGRIQIAGFTLFSWYIICVSHGFYRVIYWFL